MGDRASTGRRSPARSRARAPVRARRDGRSPRWCRARGGSPCARRRIPRWPMGSRASPGGAFSVLSGPLRSVRPMGWIGVRYTTSKPSSASRGSCASTPASPPKDRGNNSYQEPNRASAGSTSISNAGPTVVACRSAVAADGGASLLKTRSTSSDSTPIRRAPYASSSARSVWPASTRRRSSSRHVAIGSTHATTRNSQRPHSVTSKSAANRSGSVATGVISRSLHRRTPRRRYRTAAPTTSWPWVKATAVACTTSPTLRFTGWRPQPTVGVTSSITIRGGASPQSGPGIPLMLMPRKLGA